MKSCGDKVRDLLGDMPDFSEAETIVTEGAQPCAYHIPLERKIAKQGVALAFIGDEVSEIKSIIQGRIDCESASISAKLATLIAVVAFCVALVLDKVADYLIASVT